MLCNLSLGHNNFCSIYSDLTLAVVYSNHNLQSTSTERAKFESMRIIPLKSYMLSLIFIEQCFKVFALFKQCKH